MVTLRAVGCTTAEYVGTSGTADTSDSTAAVDDDDYNEAEQMWYNCSDAGYQATFSSCMPWKTTEP